jgi:6-pyruvoyltetrahydropterin/6-carboxytetrahydropterin synthase
VSVDRRFRASHQLSRADGSKEAAHWHDWAVTAEVRNEKLDSTGVVMDFGQLKSALGSIADELDNKSLESIDYFRRNNPSAENVARYVYEQLSKKLPAGVRLDCIRVMEEPGCSVKFSKGR